MHIFNTININTFIKVETILNVIILGDCNQCNMIICHLMFQMNTTRSFWSNKCCKYRYHKEYIFLGTTGFAFVVALLFYVLAKICTDKKVTDVLPRKFLEIIIMLKVIFFFSENRFAGSFNVSTDT